MWNLLPSFLLSSFRKKSFTKKKRLNNLRWDFMSLDHDSLCFNVLKFYNNENDAGSSKIILKLPYGVFALDVIAVISVSPYKRILTNFFC